MAFVSQTVRLDMKPQKNPPHVDCTQYDSGTDGLLIHFVLFNDGSEFSVPSGYTAKLEGTTKENTGFIIDPYSIDVHGVSFNLTEDATAFKGSAWCKIVFEKGTSRISPSGFWLDNDRAGVEADTVIGASGFEEQIRGAVDESVADYLQDYAIDDAVVRDAVDGYLDESSIVSESITTATTDWLNDNVTPVGSAVVVDSSLSIAGAAADAKETGDRIRVIDDRTAFNPNYNVVYETHEENGSLFNIYSYIGGKSAFVDKENYSAVTGVPYSVSTGSRTPLFPVKSGTTLKCSGSCLFVWFDFDKNFVSSQSVNNSTTIVPDGVYYAGASSSSDLFILNHALVSLYADAYVTNWYLSSDNFRAAVDDTVSVIGMPPDARKVADKLNTKLEVEYVYEGVSSSEPNLPWNPANGTKYIKQEDLLIGKTVNSKGEVVDGTSEANAVTRMLPVKPESIFKIYGTSFVLYFYDKAGNYLSRSGGSGYAYITITVPANAFYVRFFGLTDNLDGAIEQQRLIQSNYIPTKVYPKSDSLHVDFENIDNLTLQSVIFEGEPSRRLKCMAIQQTNKMRHAWRVASWNTYGTGGAGNRNWTAIKELLQNYGIDMIGFQEVNTPLSPNSAGQTFQQALTSWQFTQFGIIQTESVPTNCRPVATTGEFEVVSITETKYTTQSNYGNRYFTRTEVKLPRWKDKKASENFKVSIYNTQLEVGTSEANNNTRLAQAAQLIAAMNADTNPFIILVGDFNEMSTGWDTVNAFKNAGYTPQLQDTSTPTGGRGFYDFIFVNERIRILENEVVPYDLHYYYPGGVRANISDHDLVFADVVFDYENLIALKTAEYLNQAQYAAGTYCTFSFDRNWLDRRQTEPVTVTVTANSGYTISEISTGQGDNDLTYSNGAVVLSGNTVTIKPNLVVGDVWINVTVTATET